MGYLDCPACGISLLQKDLWRLSSVKRFRNQQFLKGNTIQTHNSVFEEEQLTGGQGPVVSSPHAYCVSRIKGHCFRSTGFHPYIWRFEEQLFSRFLNLSFLR